MSILHPKSPNTLTLVADKYNLTRWQWKWQVVFMECLLCTLEVALITSFYLHDTPVSCLFPLNR